MIPSSFKESTILADTNFLIDIYSSPKNFEELASQLEKLHITLCAINLVKFEFVRSKTVDVTKQKLIYFNNLIKFILPIDETTEDLVIEVIKEYKQYIERVPITDLILAACLKRYKGLYLLTRDHLDFPTTIFERKYIFSIEGIRDIKTYAFYQFKSSGMGGMDY